MYHGLYGEAKLAKSHLVLLDEELVGEIIAEFETGEEDGEAVDDIYCSLDKHDLALSVEGLCGVAKGVQSRSSGRERLVLAGRGGV